MTAYKQKERKSVPIQYKQFEGNLLESSDDFTIYLINGGSLALDLDGERCFIGGKAVICTNNLDKIKLIYHSKSVIDALCFAPHFINVNLNWNVIRGSEYKKLSSKHEYPDFKLFLNRSPIYNGILLLDDSGCDKIYEKMHMIENQLSEKPGDRWSCRSRGFLFEIMDILNIYYKRQIGIHPDDSLVWDICQHVNLNLSDTLSLDYLSNYFSVNRTTLTERFKAVIGTTITEYIKTKRIDRIKHLLAFTELSLSEISRQAGFSDPTYLSKIFMKNMGITPLKYRREMKNARSQDAGSQTCAVPAIGCGNISS